MCILCDLAGKQNEEPEMFIALCGLCGAMILGLPQFMELHDKYHQKYDKMVKAGEN